MYKKNVSNLKQVEMDNAIRIWNSASISLFDIRHNLISSNDPICDYRLPASTFLFTIGGESEILMNDTSYGVNRFGLFHGGKGTQLSVLPGCDWLEYYMVLYKTSEPPIRKSEYSRLMEQGNPFWQQYGFEPDNPIFLSELMRKMYEKWKEPVPLNLFYGKTAFYQLVYEIYDELQNGTIPVLQPDIVAMAKRFMDGSYTQNVSIQDMATSLNVSYSHLHRVFSRQMGKSPQEYLTEVRLNAGRKSLEQSELSLREIANGTGFSNEHHFNRMFVRHIGVTPGEYRKKMATNKRDYALGNCTSFPYNLESQVSFDKLKGKGATNMLKQMRSKSVIAAALSLMLLLSACGTAPATSTTGADSSTPIVTSQTKSAQKETKTVSTVMGDVEVPVDPQRVAVWVYEQELHSLGVTPVSVSPGNYEEVWPGIQTFSYAPEKEELLALEPDLLITYDDASFFETYQSIAPVICIPLSTPPEEALRLIGDILNLSDKANELIAAFDKQVERAKASIDEVGALGKTAVLIEPHGDEIWLYDNAYGRGGSVLYDYLGFQLPELVKNELGAQHFLKLSLEVLPQYCNADYVVVVANDTYNELKERAIWKSIPAVKNNHVIEYAAEQYNGRGLDSKTLSFFSNWVTDNAK